MNEEIINRTMQVFLYAGGFVAFWQITKHMPKVLFNLLEFICIMALTVSCMTPIVGIIEYILAGNIHTTMAYMGCCAGVGFISGLWMTLVQISRAGNNREQYRFLVL
jgi:hypothetical protein